MYLPELTQQIQCRSWQGDKAVLVAFGVANMHTPTFGIDISHLKP